MRLVLPLGPRPTPVLPRGRTGALASGGAAAALGLVAAMMLALGLAAGRLAADWSDAAAQTATLQIAVPEAEMETQARAALAVLRETPGIDGVRVVELPEQQALLTPWLGTEVALDALPLPLLIEVTVAPVGLDRAALDRRLAREAPGAVFEDHASWRRPLAAQARWLRASAWAGLGLLALVLAMLVGLATGARIGGAPEAVRTLRLIGAPQRVLGRAVAVGAAIQAGAGAAAGTALGAVLLARLPSESAQGFFVVAIAPSGWHWALLVLVPAAAAAIGWASARVALARHLRGAA